MSLVLLAVVSTLATRPAPPVPPCAGNTTQEANQCYSARLDAANAELARYVQAARKRLKDESGDEGVPAASKGFEASEKLWAKYRDVTCGAVFDYWSSGTIRTVESLDCAVTLTRLHTHSVWRQWLRYMDSTPAILPEPAFSED
jgi:uncharacterized protein YecT (DUF1311 family)